MNIIYKSRQCGKTTDLLEFANKHKGNNVIVCPSLVEASKLSKIIAEKKYDLKTISWYEFLHSDRLRGKKRIDNFFIDNAEVVLQCLTPVNIACITVNRNDVNPEFRKEYEAKVNDD